MHLSSTAAGALVAGVLTELDTATYTARLDRMVRTLAGHLIHEVEGVTPAAVTAFAYEYVLASWRRHRPDWFAGYCREHHLPEDSTVAEVLAAAARAVAGVSPGLPGGAS